MLHGRLASLSMMLLLILYICSEFVNALENYVGDTQERSMEISNQCTVMIKKDSYEIEE